MKETPVLLRTSERQCFRRCRQKWLWRYVIRLAPIGTKGALAFGSGMHIALFGDPFGRYPAWYKPGLKRAKHSPVDTWLRWYKDQDHTFDQWDDEGNRVPADELGIAMLEGYLEKHGKDEHIEVIQPEMRFAIDVYDDKNRLLFTSVGRFDTIIRNLNTNRIQVFETKTGKSIEEARVVSGYGEQGLSYLWAATIYLRSQRVLRKKEFVDSVLFNWLRKGLPDERPHDANGYALNKPTKAVLKAAAEEHGLDLTGTVDQLMDTLRKAGKRPELLGAISSRQPPPLFDRQELIVAPRSLKNFERRIRAEYKDMKRVRSGKLDVYKNPTKDCRWECEFASMCEVHEMGGDYESVMELEFGKWDPYEEHELEMENINAR